MVKIAAPEYTASGVLVVLGVRIRTPRTMRVMPPHHTGPSIPLGKK